MISGGVGTAVVLYMRTRACAKQIENSGRELWVYYDCLEYLSRAQAALRRHHGAVTVHHENFGKRHLAEALSLASTLQEDWKAGMAVAAAA